MKRFLLGLILGAFLVLYGQRWLAHCKEMCAQCLAEHKNQSPEDGSS